jgi:hypothetical protein
MPIVVLGLSGYCNGYRATVAVICNNLSHLSRSLYQLRLGRFYHNQSHLDQFHCLYLSHNLYYSSQPLSQSYLDRPLHQHHLSRFYYDRSHLSRFYHGRSRLDQFRRFHLSYSLYYLSRSLRQPCNGGVLWTRGLSILQLVALEGRWDTVVQCVW